MADEKYEQILLRLLVFVVYAVCTWKLEGRSMIFSFHRMRKISQR